ncbi:hypothetical protein BHM03_00022792, partial [Ensete ventricosum]
MPIIGRYRQLGLFLSRYSSKQVGNDRFRLSSSAEGWYQLGYGLSTTREKEEEGEETGEPGGPAALYLDDSNPSSPSLVGHHKQGEVGIAS